MHATQELDHMSHHMATKKLTKVDRYKWKVIDEPGRFMWIAKKHLHVDLRYQRDLSKHKTLSTASEWSWLACGALRVADRDGVFFIVDGYNRYKAALKRADIPELPCLVFRVGGPKDEAEAFGTTNEGRQNPTALDHYRKELFVGKRAAIDVQTLGQMAGRTFDKTAKPNTIRCVGLLMKLAAADRDSLYKIWPLIIRVCNGNVMHERVIESLYYIEKHMPNNESITDRRWAERIEKLGYAQILEACHQAAAFYSKGGASVWAVGVVNAINKGRRNRLELV